MRLHVRKYSLVWICLVLILITVIPYSNVHEGTFLSFDDKRYVSENPFVPNGLSRENVRWAFSAGLFFQTPFIDYWQPMTTLSHMLDVALFGLNPAAHHLMNLLFHTLNVLLLFGLLFRLTGARLKSCLVATLFAIHPIHVEVVAWITARKDLLSLFFALIAMHVYVSVRTRPKQHSILFVALPFTLAMWAKPTVMTLPMALVLLDFWPLSKIRLGSFWKDLGASILHKWILFLSAVIFAPIALLSRTETAERLTQAPQVLDWFYAYTGYIKIFLFPLGAGIHGPSAYVSVQVWQYALSVLAITGITLLALRARRSHPYGVVGWLWFLGILFPLISASFIMERFMYVPGIGLLIAIVWFVGNLCENQIERTRQSQVHIKNVVALLAGGLVITLLAGITYLQVDYWRNDFTLWRRALDLNSNNYLAQYNMGTTLTDAGRADLAMKYFSKTLELMPENRFGAQAAGNLGGILIQTGREEEGISYLRRTLSIDAQFENAHNLLGVALAKQGKFDEAIDHFREEIKYRPNYREAHENLKRALRDKKASKTSGA
jgi:protein O-mannosyl-transferase